MKLPTTHRGVGPAVNTERWYDRGSRSWVVQKKDVEGNQIGDAAYVGSKREAILIEAEWRKEIVSHGLASALADRTKSGQS